jgi:hypothetical protein
LKYIKLTNCDDFAIVSDEDYEELSKYTWYLGKNGYVARHKLNSDDEKYPKGIYMHRQVMDVILAGKNIHVDHINHNKKDNNRNNLRLSDYKTNAYNKRIDACKTEDSTSLYKGVYYVKITGKFYARINSVNLGQFEDEETAALAYDQAARYLDKDFACLNFPDRDENIINIDKCMNYKEYTTSKYRGVSLYKQNGKYVVYIAKNGKSFNAGYYENEIIAAKAYDLFSDIFNTYNKKRNFNNYSIHVLINEVYKYLSDDRKQIIDEFKKLEG